jgi:hypothetical protein
MHPEIGAEPTLLGFNCGFYSSKKNQSHPDGIAGLCLNTLPTLIILPLSGIWEKV